MKTRKKSKDRQVKKELDKSTSHPQVEKEEEDKPFDFGGLPNRDLKKNLGCG